ncbi:MAG: LysE family translocator [Candidatus Korobacteraceae bacterium]|jgi:threonine/homoserine/homoserine lactone efflux protein
MPSLSLYFVFLGAAFVLLITPGPAVLYIVARSIDQGRLAGLVSCLGITVGTLIHVTAAALGLSALLMSSPAAIHVIRFLGAAYLVYLGISRFRAGDHLDRNQFKAPQSLAAIFRQGVVVNLFNPKTILFLFAFLPQFVRLENGPVGRQVFFLGCSLVLMGMVTDSCWALLAGSMAKLFSGHAGFARVQRYTAGTVYLALGLATALSSL